MYDYDRQTKDFKNTVIMKNMNEDIKREENNPCEICGLKQLTICIRALVTRELFILYIRTQKG